MFNLMFGLTIVANCVEGIKEHFKPIIPAENWANKELIRQDISNNVSAKQRIKNAQSGKYKVDKKHTEPHRNLSNGKIIIENNLLYKEDCKKYGAYQAGEWVKQGKYNLSPEELKKEKERIEKDWEKLYSLVR